MNLRKDLEPIQPLQFIAPHCAQVCPQTTIVMAGDLVDGPDGPTGAPPLALLAFLQPAVSMKLIQDIDQAGNGIALTEMPQHLHGAIEQGRTFLTYVEPRPLQQDGRRLGPHGCKLVLVAHGMAADHDQSIPGFSLGLFQQLPICIRPVVLDPVSGNVPHGRLGVRRRHLREPGQWVTVISGKHFPTEPSELQIIPLGLRFVHGGIHGALSRCRLGGGFRGRRGLQRRQVQQDPRCRQGIAFALHAHAVADGFQDSLATAPCEGGLAVAGLQDQAVTAGQLQGSRPGELLPAARPAKDPVGHDFH